MKNIQIKKTLILLVISIFLFGPLHSQKVKPAGSQTAKAMNNTVTIGISFPVDVFKQTHHAGLSVDYSWSKGRFNRHIDSFSLLRLAINGGISYHPGKKTSSVGYEFEYSNYLNIHGLAGIDYKPSNPLHITLFTGPVISIYKNNSDAGFGASLFSSYYITDNISLGPGLTFRTFTKTNALWSGTFRASYTF